MISNPTISLKGRALQLLAMRDYSRAEIEGKLLRWMERQAMVAANESGDTACLQALENGDERKQQHLSAIAEVLNALQTQGYLDDRRAAEAFMRSRSSKFGSLRIRHELQHKGIEPDLAHELLSTLRESETVRAQALWQKKFGVYPTNSSERAKQMRYLVGRGFSMDAVATVLRGKADTAN